MHRPTRQWLHIIGQTRATTCPRGSVRVKDDVQIVEPATKRPLGVSMAMVGGSRGYFAGRPRRTTYTPPLVRRLWRTVHQREDPASSRSEYTARAPAARATRGRPEARASADETAPVATTSDFLQPAGRSPLGSDAFDDRRRTIAAVARPFPPAVARSASAPPTPRSAACKCPCPCPTRSATSWHRARHARGPDDRHEPRERVHRGARAKDAKDGRIIVPDAKLGALLQPVEGKPLTFFTMQSASALKRNFVKA